LWAFAWTVFARIWWRKNKKSKKASLDGPLTAFVQTTSYDHGRWRRKWWKPLDEARLLRRGEAPAADIELVTVSAEAQSVQATADAPQNPFDDPPEVDITLGREQRSWNAV
jgi:hypothetical protein